MNLSLTSTSPAPNVASLGVSCCWIANVPFTVELNISLHSLNVPFSRIERTSCPAMSTGLGPNDLAVPLTQISWFTTNTLLSNSGPSTVAVKFGASRTSKVNDRLDGRR